MRKIIYLIQCPPQWIKTPPLGLECIRNYLKTKNIETKIIDLNIIAYKLIKATKKDWLSLNKEFGKNLFFIIKENAPSLFNNLIKKIKDAWGVGISLFKHNQSFSFNVASMLRKIYPHLTIVFGGPHTLFMKLYKDTFLNEFKWVIGEGESGIYTLIKDKKQTVIEYEELDDIDNLPFVEFNSFNIKMYSFSLPLISSRGCIRKCNFCTERLLYKKFRQHSPQYIVEQIKYLIKKHNVSNFVFQDSLINANLKWLEEFSRLIIKNKLNIKWEAQAIIRDDFSCELAELMKKSGCFNLFIGLESASDKILQDMNKGFTQKQALDFFKALKRGKLHFEISIIVDYPGETEKNFEETVNFIVKNKSIIPKIAQINPYIDYFTRNYTPQAFALQKVNRLVKILEKEKIPYTKSFINNLIYNHAD